jgi:hypothetical protein
MIIRSSEFDASESDIASDSGNSADDTLQSLIFQFLMQPSEFNSELSPSLSEFTSDNGAS